MKGTFRKKIVVIFAVLLLTVYVMWRMFFTLPTRYGMLVVSCGLIMLICETVSAFETIVHFIKMMREKIPELPIIPIEWYPDVDVFIATHNEPEEVLYKTINGCTYMNYPDKSKVHIWVCDDNNRENISKLAKKLGVGYIGLANNTLAKAGNLNNALSKTSAELIVTFDADMIPTREFLMKTVPYFYLPKLKKNAKGEWVNRKENEIDKDYKIGFIQTPQSFYNPDLFQYNLYSEKNIPNEQDYFFKEINVGRNTTNSPIYAGSNTVISREALELVGGIATGTITEDFETGIKIQDEGYTCYAIPNVYAHGLAPDTIESLIKQRERWGRGCVYSLRKIKIWQDKKMSFGAKLSYFSCKVYWWSFFRRFVFMLSPIIFAIFGIPVVDCQLWEMLCIWLPSYVMILLANRELQSDIRVTRWSNIIDTVMFPYLFMPIIYEAIGIRKKNFHVTEKSRAVNTQTDTIIALPHILLAGMSVIAIVSCLGQMLQYNTFSPIVILYWLIVNFASLVMSIFFMLGRKNRRMTERFRAEIPVTLKCGVDIKGVTCDISEEGIAVLFDRPYDIYIHDDICAELKTKHYNSNMTLRVVHSAKVGDKWRYSFKIVDMEEIDRREYYQMVYDRDHSLPDVMDENYGCFEEIKNNIMGRTKRKAVVKEKRRNIRIPIENYIRDVKENNHYIVDYNFRCMTIRLKDNETVKGSIKIPTRHDGIFMEMVYKRMINDRDALYYIKNHRQLSTIENFKIPIDEYI